MVHNPQLAWMIITTTPPQGNREERIHNSGPCPSTMAAKPLYLSPKPLHPPPQPPHLLPSSALLRRPSLLPSPRIHTLPPRSSSSRNNNGSTQPGTECPVPFDQLPINEYRNLSDSFPFSWASGDIVEYFSRLCATGLAFGLLVGLPVSWVGSGGSDHDPVKLVLGSASSGLVAVTLAVVRMYLGWAYVGNRLLSATVEYEETGWYDGQMWVKTAEVLARDRLLGSFQVKPILGRLKNSLVALGISLFVCVGVFVNYEESQKEALRSSNATGDRVIAGVYNDESARSFEPDAFCGDSGFVAE